VLSRPVRSSLGRAVGLPQLTTRRSDSRQPSIIASGFHSYRRRRVDRTAKKPPGKPIARTGESHKGLPASELQTASAAAMRRAVGRAKLSVNHGLGRTADSRQPSARVDRFQIATRGL